MPKKQLIQIETDLHTKGLNFFTTSEMLTNKAIVATIADAVKNLEKEKTKTIRASKSCTANNHTS